MFNKQENQLRDWATQNGLNYIDKIKPKFLSLENVTLKNIVWGVYKSKRLYFFAISNSSGRITRNYYYLNGNFYENIDIENIDKVIENKNAVEIVYGVFGSDSEVETVGVLVAQIYLDSGTVINRENAKNIFNLFGKYDSTKSSFKDKLIGFVAGVVKEDIKYNSPEAISFFIEKTEGKIERKTIEEITNTYEKLLIFYNQN